MRLVFSKGRLHRLLEAFVCPEVVLFGDKASRHEGHGSVQDGSLV
jgi:hypothetical protein